MHYIIAIKKIKFDYRFYNLLLYLFEELVEI